MKLLWDDAGIRRLIEDRAVRALNAGAATLTNRVKELISVPAPRRIVHAPRGDYYVATTPAAPGAPPRKLSGRLRTSVAYEVNRPKLVARVGSNVIYAKPLETWMAHQFIGVSLHNHRAEIWAVMKAVLKG